MSNISGKLLLHVSSPNKRLAQFLMYFLFQPLIHLSKMMSHILYGISQPTTWDVPAYYVGHPTPLHGISHVLCGMSQPTMWDTPATSWEHPRCFVGCPSSLHGTSQVLYGTSQPTTWDIPALRESSFCLSYV